MRLSPPGRGGRLSLHNADGGKSDYRHEGKKFGSHKIFLCPRRDYFFEVAGSERAKNQRGEVLRRFQIRLTTSSFGKITSASQVKFWQIRIVDSGCADAEGVGIAFDRRV
jgi:hypothetical protein